MFVELTSPNGKEYTVGVTVKYEYVNDKPVNTIITINDSGSEYVGKATCHVEDNVNKAYGRRAALRDLFSKHFFTKENRQILYEALIPKLINRQDRDSEDDNEFKLECSGDFFLNSWLFVAAVLMLAFYFWR